MANFAPAFEYVIRNEDASLAGVVTPEPNGGKARFGINSVFHPEAVAAGFYEMEHNKALEYAQAVYMKDYWIGHGFAAIADQRIATKLFDIAINMGNGGELRVLQEALGVPQTHRMDTVTQAALIHVGPTFMAKLINVLKAHYQAIYDKHPDKYGKYIHNWLARAEKVPT